MSGGPFRPFAPMLLLLLLLMLLCFNVGWALQCWSGGLQWDQRPGQKTFEGPFSAVECDNSCVSIICRYMDGRTVVSKTTISRCGMRDECQRVTKAFCYTHYEKRLFFSYPVNLDCTECTNDLCNKDKRFALSGVNSVSAKVVLIVLLLLIIAVVHVHSVLLELLLQ